MALANHAWFDYWLNHYTEAQKLAEQSVKLAQSSSSVALTSKMKSLNLLSAIAKNKGLLAKARSYAQEALNLAKTLKDIRRIPVYLTSLAIMEEQLNNHQHAEDLYLEAQRIYQKQGNHYEFIKSLQFLGHLKLKVEQPQRAVDLFSECFNLAQKHDFNHLAPQILASLGLTYYDLQDYPKAKGFIEKGLTLWQSNWRNFPQDYAAFLVISARIDTALNDFRRAQHDLIEASKIFWDSHSVSSIVQCLIYLGELSEKQSKFEHANFLYQAALHYAPEQKLRELITKQLKHLKQQGIHSQTLPLDNVTLDAFLANLFLKSALTKT